MISSDRILYNYIYNYIFYLGLIKLYTFNIRHFPLICRLTTEGVRMIFSVFLSVSVLSAVLGQCPEDLQDLPNAAFSPSAGCLWADSDEEHRFDNYEEAAQRCRLVRQC